MNAIVQESLSFDLNPSLSRARLAEQFKTDRRVHVTNFLPHAAADLLGRQLMDEMAYQTYVVANEDELGTPPGEGSLTADEEKELLELACEGARKGFASYFDANRSLSSPQEPDESADLTRFGACVKFLNSRPFLDFVSSVTGLEKIQRAEVHATRFRPGHFVLFNNATWTADPSGKRRINFELNLTRQWRPEWGGMLEWRGQQGHQIDAVMPCFNCLDLFSFPRGYWISQVTPFAHASRYAIAGSLYVD